MQTAKNTRSEQARINGAKSRGPITPQGQRRARTAPLHHGLYATDATLKPTVDDTQSAALRADYQSAWAAPNRVIADKVDDLVAIRWELNRVREVRRQHFAALYNDIAAHHNAKTNNQSVVAEAEIQANAASGTVDRFDLRIRRYHLEISRIERDILRDLRHFSASAGSHMSLKTNDEEPNQNPIDWVEETFGLALDPHQESVLTTTAQTTVLAAARYSGKTTALALRALHEAASNPFAQVACLSPTGALLAKVQELALTAGATTANITSALTRATTLVLIDDATRLKALPPVPIAARVILAGTPNGPNNVLHSQWQRPDAAKIHGPAANCAIISDALLQRAKDTLSPAQLRQEFGAEFIDPPQPRCDLFQSDRSPDQRPG
jgi:hypothetical protein